MKSVSEPVANIFKKLGVPTRGFVDHCTEKGYGDSELSLLPPQLPPVPLSLPIFSASVTGIGKLLTFETN